MDDPALVRMYIPIRKLQWIEYTDAYIPSTSHLPVLYVFGQQSLDHDHCIHEFEQLFPDHSTPVIVMCDVEYSYAVGK